MGGEDRGASAGGYGMAMSASSQRTASPSPTTIRLRGGPFLSFADAVAFQGRVASLPGVHSASIRHYFDAHIVLDLLYGDERPLEAHIRALQDDTLIPVTVGPGLIEVLIARRT